jgi:hypothetical protein
MKVERKGDGITTDVDEYFRHFRVFAQYLRHYWFDLHAKVIRGEPQ